jgi:hypothetical protein
MTKVNNEKIHREKGYLYYLGKDGYVWASPMKSNPHGKTHKVGTEHVKRGNGMYFVNKEGYLEFRPR